MGKDHYRIEHRLTGDRSLHKMGSSAPVVYLPSSPSYRTTEATTWVSVQNTMLFVLRFSFMKRLPSNAPGLECASRGRYK